MDRPDPRATRRRELLPVVAGAFAELGYRRASTAELAERCGVRVNILYRLWPDKKAMFLDTIDHVFESSRETWESLLADGVDERGAAHRLLGHEAEHLGEHGLYRVLFAGLGETDDPEIRDALARTFGRFVGYLRELVGRHRAGGDRATLERAAWALVGLGTACNIGRELGLLDGAQRAELMGDVGDALLDG